MHPRERLRLFTDRRSRAAAVPEGVRLVVWPVLALEEWDMARPMARMVISPPQGQPMLPDHPNWSWHEYGMRVGFWRLRKMFDRARSMTPTVTLNARVCETYPHGGEGLHRQRLGAECARLRPGADAQARRPARRRSTKSMDVIEKFCGKRPRGWFGPGLTQTFDTLDYLSEAGIEYIGDWVLDDEPVTLKTTHKPVVALPYNFEIHDIVHDGAADTMPSDEWYARALDHFECALRGIRRARRRSWRSPVIPISPACRIASAMWSAPSRKFSATRASWPGTVPKSSTGTWAQAKHDPFIRSYWALGSRKCTGLTHASANLPQLLRSP